MRQQTVIKIIRLMRKNLGEGLTIREIAKQLNIGYRPAYNHVTAMEQERIVHIKKVGSAKQCTLALENEKTRHLLAEVDLEKKNEVYNKNPKVKSVLEILIAKLTEKHITEIQAIILFGSYAKGATSRTSDIDLLFMVNDLKKKDVRENIERECASYQYSHNIKISPLITDLEEFRKMLKGKEINVGKEVREYGIALYGAEMFWRLLA